MADHLPSDGTDTGPLAAPEGDAPSELRNPEDQALQRVDTVSSTLPDSDDVPILTHTSEIRVRNVQENIQDLPSAPAERDTFVDRVRDDAAHDPRLRSNAAARESMRILDDPNAGTAALFFAALLLLAVMMFHREKDDDDESKPGRPSASGNAPGNTPPSAPAAQPPRAIPPSSEARGSAPDGSIPAVNPPSVPTATPPVAETTAPLPPTRSPETTPPAEPAPASPPSDTESPSRSPVNEEPDTEYDDDDADPEPPEGPEEQTGEMMERMRKEMDGLRMTHATALTTESGARAFGRTAAYVNALAHVFHARIDALQPSAQGQKAEKAAALRELEDMMDIVSEWENAAQNAMLIYTDRERRIEAVLKKLAALLTPIGPLARSVSDSTETDVENDAEVVRVLESADTCVSQALDDGVSLDAIVSEHNDAEFVSALEQSFRLSYEEGTWRLIATGESGERPDFQSLDYNREQERVDELVASQNVAGVRLSSEQINAAFASLGESPVVAPIRGEHLAASVVPDTPVMIEGQNIFREEMNTLQTRRANLRESSRRRYAGMNRSIVRGCLQIGAAMESAEGQEHEAMARSERLPKKMGLLELLGAESGISATIRAERNYRDRTVVAYAQLDAYLVTRVNDFPMRAFRPDSEESDLTQYRIELLRYREETEREVVRLIRELGLPDYAEATREFNKVEEKIRSTIVSVFKEPGSAAFGAPGAILGSFVGRMVYQQSKMDGVDFDALISRFRSEELASFVGDIAEEAAGLVGLGNTKNQAKSIFGVIAKLIPRRWRRAIFRGLVSLLEEAKDALKARIGGAANEQAEKAINTLFDAWKAEADSAS